MVVNIFILRNSKTKKTSVPLSEIKSGTLIAARILSKTISVCKQ